MKNVKYSLVLAIAIALTVLVVQNTTPVQARFLWFTAEMPVVLLLFFTATGGFVLGLLVALLMKTGGKPKV